jgi:hypothetical protein
MKPFRNAAAGRLCLLLSAAMCAAAANTSLAAVDAGSVVLDVQAATITFGDQTEPFEPLGNSANRCDIDQREMTLLEFTGTPEPSISLQRGSWGLKGSTQGCAFIEETEQAEMHLGSGVGDLAQVVGWSLNFIVIDDAVFDVVLLDAAGAERQRLTVYTGKNACDPYGTSGVPITLDDDEASFFECVAQSNPNADFAFVLTPADFPALSLPDWHGVRIEVTAGDVGMTGATLNLGLPETGILTCEEDSTPPEGATTITEEALFEVAGGAVCRRLPNRPVDGVLIPQCEAVPYYLDASCLESDPTDCSVTFVHGDQLDGSGNPLPRDAYAFLCEVWWPPRDGNFTTNGAGVPVPDEPILNRTEVYWGGLTTPLERGDVDATYCGGATPIFSVTGSEPNPLTTCGNDLDYDLSAQKTSPTGVQDGGDVSPNGVGLDDTQDCSLLEAYDDVLLPDLLPDQCNSATCSQPGRQRICLIDERIFQVEDPDADCTGGTPGSCPGTTPGEVDQATSKYGKFERHLIEGDIKLRAYQ